MSDSVGQYLNEIGLVPLLTADEERELSQTIERGRDAQEHIEAGERSRELRKAVAAAAAAKDRFIRANLRLVVSVARRYPLPPSMELLDLIQEGNLGLEHAVDKFDPRARYAVEQRFGLVDGRKRSYREVGEDLGVTAEAARRLVKRAVNAVREQAQTLVFDAA